MGPRRERRNDPVTEITGLHFGSYVLVWVFTFSTLQGRNSLQQALNLLLLVSNLIPEFLVLSRARHSPEPGLVADEPSCGQWPYAATSDGDP